MSKNIVVCCDGTGNEIEINLSNVLKLYRCLKKDDEQVVYYDTGIGTVSQSDDWGQGWNKIKAVFGLMTGRGMNQNVLDAYKFLVKNYETGDQIYLFGFSRGAHTVRVLAGFLRVVGLLNPNQENLFEYALTSYKKVLVSDDEAIGWRVNKIAEGKYVPIKFIGVWDTVSSVLVPREDQIFPTMQKLPYTGSNVLVEVFRHAISIDERRRMFRADHWKEGQLYKRNPFMTDENKKTVQQNSKQVWFAGVHSDVGGGYPEEESGIAKFPLKWMIDEAKGHGLLIKTQMYNHLANGKRRQGGNQNYVVPDHKAEIHSSLTFWWWSLELMPKLWVYREWPRRWLMVLWAFYFPRGEPREIKDGELIHQSVIDRIKDVGGYDPENLPKNYLVEP